MNRSAKGSVVVGAAVVVSALLGSEVNAFAEDATVGVGANTTLSPRSASMSAQAAGAGAAPTGPTMTDHELVVGRIGASWLGTLDVPVGPPTGTGLAPLPTPIIGARYWVNGMLGVDAGLGFFTNSSSSNPSSGATTEFPSRTAFVFHAGVPLALADTHHFTFLVIPEINVGIGSGSIKGSGMTPTSDLSGFIFEGGVRAGAEVYFGFMGLPQLSLEGSLGVFVSSRSGKVSQGSANTRYSEFTIATSSVAQPWDIFRKDVAARYYF